MILAQQASSAYCDRQFWRDVSCGSKTEVSGLARHVRFTLWSRHRQPAPACPFGAMIRTRALQQMASLFDHVVGAGEQRLRTSTPSALAQTEVDFQLCLDGCKRGGI